jgi:hypothetical protein
MVDHWEGITSYILRLTNRQKKFGGFIGQNYQTVAGGRCLPQLSLNSGDVLWGFHP